jgi:cytochrome d ubiquinol oxidase subunit I
MDALVLARLQFAGTTGIHWLFVILTLGLVPLVAVMHTRAAFARSAGRRAGWERAARFWGQLYVVNYALGIVTGLVMEFQFGLSWSGLSKFAGNVIGAPLALETLIAFFAESTFLGMWIFGWGKLRPGLHAALIWLVALTAYASAYWILVANGFMQHPVGFEVRDGVAYLTDFGALLTNPNALLPLGHIAMGALLAGGLFVAGVSAFHLARGTAEAAFFRRALRTGTLVAATVAYPAFALGGIQYPQIAATQPMKLALLSGPDAPGAAELAADMAARHGPGDYVPPAWVGTAQYVMLYLGYAVFAIAVIALVVAHRDRVVRSRALTALAVAGAPLPLGEFVGGLLFLEPGPYRWPIYAGCVVLVAVLLRFGNRLPARLGYLLVAVIPLPFAASVAGWLVREVGRQPWIVYGRLTVEQALSPVGAGALLASTIAFFAIFLALAVTNWVLIARFAARGPAGTQLGAPEPLPAAHPVPTF